MGLEFFVRDPELHGFDQAVMLKKIGRGKMDGVCLTLSAAYLHLRREGLEPEDIITMFRASYLLGVIADIHEKYGAGGFSGGSRQEMQEETTLRELHDTVRQRLVKDRKVANKVARLLRCGDYPAGDKPKIRPNLLDKALDERPKLFLVGFLLQGGRMGIDGGHAIAIDGTDANWGIFDPNYGYMPLQRGMNGIDLGVVLNEFVSEYGITTAFAFQDVTGMW